MNVAHFLHWIQLCFWIEWLKTKTPQIIHFNHDNGDRVLDDAGRLLVFLSLTEQGTEMIKRGTYI